MKNILAVIVLCCVCSAVTAADFLPGMNVSSKGIITIEDIKIMLVHYDDKWGPVDQNWLGEKPVKAEKGVWKVTGGLPSKSGGSFNFEETIKKVDDKLNINYKLTSEKGVGTKALSLAIMLPIQIFEGEIIYLGGSKIKLPEKFNGQQVFGGKSIKSITIPLENGSLVIEGNFSIYLQDNRQWKGKNFQLQIAMPVNKDEPVKNSELSLTISKK